jgi:ArsR family transcriptional regulator
MELYKTLEIFASLAQETRLKVFKFVLEYGRDGVAAGVISDELKIPANTLSFHLSHMSNAGLVTSKKSGRSVTYFANSAVIDQLIEFLEENCCAREKSKKSKSAKNCNERNC